MVGDIAGVNPKQATAANATLRKLGAPGHYDHKGNLHIQNASDYKEWQRLTGRVNRSCGLSGNGGRRLTPDEIRSRLCRKD